MPLRQSRRREALHQSSFCLSLHRLCPQLLHCQLPCRQFLGSVAVTVVQLQGPVADRELLTTKPASWRGVHLFLLLLLQEKPVIQLDPLSTSILHLHPHQVVGLSHPWQGRLRHLLAVLTWMDHLLHHHFSCHNIKHLSAQEP